MPTATASAFTTAKALPPLPIRVVIDGEDCYEVPLTGRGEGQSFIIDAAVWNDLQTRGFPSVWIVTGGGRGYVGTTIRSAGAPDRELLTGTPRYLARIITNAQPDQVVRYRNRNSLDLRVQNLKVVDWANGPGWPSKRGWRKPKRAN